MGFDSTNKTSCSSSESPFELTLICLLLKDLGSCEDNEAETQGHTGDDYIYFQSNLMIKTVTLMMMIILMIIFLEIILKTRSVQTLTCPEPHPLPRFQVEFTFLYNWCPRLKWAECVILA